MPGGHASQNFGRPSASDQYVFVLVCSSPYESNDAKTSLICPSCAKLRAVKDLGPENAQNSTLSDLALPNIWVTLFGGMAEYMQSVVKYGIYVIL